MKEEKLLVSVHSNARSPGYFHCYWSNEEKLEFSSVLKPHLASEQHRFHL